jgi:hypothetical protein
LWAGVAVGALVLIGAISSVLGGDTDGVAQSSSTAAPTQEPTQEPTDQPSQRESEFAEPTQEPTPRPTPKVAPRRDLKVIDYGFTPDPESEGGSFAVIVENPNEAWIPNFVTINITFFDSGGGVLSTTDEILYTVLPGKAAVAGYMFDGEPAEMKVRISRLDESDWEEIERGSTGHYVFSRVRTIRQEYGGHQTTGLISSTFSGDQDSVEVTCVYIDSQGGIVGGEFTFVDQVRAGEEAAFEMSSFQTFPDLNKTRCYADIGG